MVPQRKYPLDLTTNQFFVGAMKFKLPMIPLFNIWQNFFLFSLVALFCVATAKAESPRGEKYVWDTVAMGGGGFVSAVIAHPTERGLLYARTDVGGVYRWQAADEKWIPLNDWLSEDETSFFGIESLALDPRDPNKVYAVGGTSYWNDGRTAVMSSNDRGKTWKVTDVSDLWRSNGNGMGRQSGEKLAVDPNLGSILFYGTRRHGLFRSSDAGETWTKVNGFPVETTPNGNGVSFVLFDPSSGKPGEKTSVIYAGVSRLKDNLFVSRDGGDTWSALPGAPEGLMPQRQARASNGIIYITYADGAGPHGDARVDEAMGSGAVWRFNPATGEWRDITPHGWDSPFSGVDVDAQNPGRLLVSTINTYSPQPWGWGDRLFLSNDGGETWSDLIGEGRVAMDDGGFPWIRGKAMHWVGSVTFDPQDSRRVFITSGNGIFRTDDVDAPDARWVFSVRGIEETVPIEVVSLRGGPMVSAILDYDGFVHEDVRVSPVNGNHKPHMGSCTSLAIAAQRPRWMARAGGPLQISADAGLTWKVWEHLPYEGAVGGHLAWSADAASLLWSPARSTTTYRSGDFGMTWEEIKGVEGPARFVADMHNPERFYFYDSQSGGLFASTDSGRSFVRLSSPGKRGSNRVAVSPDHEGHLWLALGSGGLSRSEDGGKSIVPVKTIGEVHAVGLGKAAPDSNYPTVFVRGRSLQGVDGVFRSTDEGRSWVRINDDAHEFGSLANGGFVVGDLNVFGRVYMSTAGRGIAFGEPAEIAGVTEREKPAKQ